jgi:hypothetical protein
MAASSGLNGRIDVSEFNAVDWEAHVLWFVPARFDLAAWPARVRQGK